MGMGMDLFQAKTIITESREFKAMLQRKYLLNLDKDVRAFYRSFFNKNWAKAIAAGERLVSKKKPDMKLYPKLARCYFRANEKEKAVDCVHRYLEAITGQPLDELILMFKRSSLLKAEDFLTTYTYSGGSGNLGMLEHRNYKTNKTYLTKIMTDRLLPKSQIEREYYFYDRIRSQSDELKQFSPALLDWTVMKYPSETLYLLTIEKINGEKPGDEELHLQQILERHYMIKSIDSEEMKRLILNSPLGGPIFFRYMHKAVTHRFAFWRMFKQAQKMKSPDLTYMILQLRKIVLENRLYKNIDPRRHYALCHFDFHRANLLMEEATGSCKVLDWSNYHLGLASADLITLFKGLNLSFEEIDRLYLSNIDMENTENRFLAIMFLYGLIFRNVMQLKKGSVREQVERFFVPAMEYILFHLK
jgi:hypothetical protein